MSKNFTKWTASALVALVGILHLLTHFATKFAGKTKEQNELLNQVRTMGFEMPGGESRTLDEIMTGYGLTWAVLLITMSAISLMTKPSKPLFWLLGLGCLCCAEIMFLYLITPPAAMLLLASILYIVTAVRYKENSNPQI